MQVITMLKCGIMVSTSLPHMNFVFHLSSKLSPNKGSFDTCLNTNVRSASLAK